MFPYIDMINHHAGEQAVIKYAKGELSTVESGRPLTVGELHLNYGDKSAVGFLAFYGFCPVRERGIDLSQCHLPCKAPSSCAHF